MDQSIFKKLLKLELRNTTIYAGVNGLTRFLGFLVIPLFWRRLKPEDFGVIALTEMIGAFLNAFQGLALDQSITRFYYEWPEDARKRNLGAVWLTNWASIFTCGAISMATVSVTCGLLFPGISFYPYIFLGMVGWTLNSLSMVPFATIRIQQKPGLFATFNIIKYGLQYGLPLWFVLGLGRGLRGYLEATALQGVLFGTFCLGLMLYQARLGFSWQVVAPSLRFSLPLLPAQITNVAGGLIDRFVLQRFASLETVGLYTVSLKFAGMVSAVHDVLKLSYGPFLFKTIEELGDRSYAVISRMIPWYTGAIFLAGTFIILFIDKFVYLAHQPAYQPIVQYVPFLVVAMMISTLNVYYAPGALLSKRTGWLVLPSIVQFTTMLGLAVIFIPTYQMAGAIGAKLVSVCAYFAVNIAISMRLFDKWKYGWSILSTYGLVVICAVAFSIFCRHVPFAINIGLSLAFGIAVCAALAIFLRAQTRAGESALAAAPSEL